MRIGFYNPELRRTEEGKVETVGGGELYIDKLMQYLNKLQGMTAELVDIENACDVELVHLYGFGLPKAEAILELKSAGHKVLFIPGWWYDPDLWKIRYRTPEQKIADLVRNSFILKWNSERRRRRAFATMAEALRAIDLITVFADEEADHLEKWFGLELPNRRKIGIGVESFFYNADPDVFFRKYGQRDFVLTVGRIEDRKNLMNLIKAVKGMKQNTPLVIIGRATDSRRHKMAAEALRTEGGERTIFIDQMPQEELASAYAAAKVYVQAALYETPGLVSLEAGVAGCRLVTTRRGCTQEIFKEWSLYCEPLDIVDIRNKLEYAFDSPVPDGQKEYFRDNFTWEGAALSALEVYKELLGTS